MEVRLLAYPLPSFKGCAVCGCSGGRRAALLPALCLAWAGVGARTGIHGMAASGAAAAAWGLKDGERTQRVSRTSPSIPV